MNQTLPVVESMLCPSIRARAGISLLGKTTTAALMALAFLASRTAQATSETWVGASGTTGNWEDTNNWSNTVVSGSTGTTTDPDTATFNAAIANGWGTSLTPIVINSATQNIKNISFDTNAGAYFIGSTGGNPLYLTGAGTTQILSTFAGSSTTETINAPLVFEGNYSFANNVTGVGSNNLVFGGNITNAATSTLTISGSGTSTGNQISGAISNGTGAQGVNVTTTAGTWTLSGANSYSGGTNIDGTGGTTILTGVNTSAGTTSLTLGTLQLNNTTANDGGLASGTLSFLGGNLAVGSAGALTLTNAVNFTNSGTISGAESLTFDGTFTNSQTKNLTNSLTGGSTLTFGGTVNLGGTSTSFLTFTLAGAGNTTFGGVIEDWSGGVGTSHSQLFISDTGTTTLSGANTYGGLTTLDPAPASILASLVFAGSNNSAGTTTVDDGILQFDSASNGGIASGLLSLTPAGGGDLVTLQSLVASPTISNNITITSASTGNVTISGANSFTLAGVVSQTASTAVTSSITGGNTLTLSGTVNIDVVSGTAQTLTIAGAGNTTISGVIEDYSGGTGSVGGNFSVSNSGTTTLSGANTYSGTTTFSGAGTMITAGSNSSAGAFTLNTTLGTLQLDSATNGGIATGLLTFTKGTLQSLVANATLSNAITLTAVTVSGAQNITLNGAFSEAGSDTLTSSITGGRILTLGGNVNIDQATNASHTLTIAGTGNTTISGVIQDWSGGVGTSHGALTITNTGFTTLSGANTYGGITTGSAGILEFANTGALYSGTTGMWTAANLITDPGATMAFNVGTGGFTSTQINTLNTNLITNATATTGFEAGSIIGFDTTGANFTYNTAIANSDANTHSIGLAKLGTNTLILGGANTYTGVTTLDGGILNVDSAETPGTSGPLGKSAAANAGSIVFGGGTLQYSSVNNNDYSGRFSTAANQPISIDTNGRAVTFATALTSAGGSLTLNDSNGSPGSLTLSAVNTYTGATTVNTGGNLIVNGSISGNMATVNSGATLAGTGTIAPTATSGAAVTINGALSPDSGSIGTINFTLAGTATLAFGSSSTLNIGISSNGTSGEVAFTAAPSAGEWLSGAGNATLALNGTINYADTYTIFQNAIATGYTGQFTFANITGYNTAAYTAEFTQSGDNYDLSFVAVPEPGTWAMMIAGFGVLVSFQRLRRRSHRLP